MRVEFYVKTGIVLLGATFPISLIVSAGGVALTQSAIISILTAAIIFFVATRVFGLDRRFAAVLGTAGSVCGVSASLAVAASVGARKDEIAASVTLVVIAAIVMVVLSSLRQSLARFAGGRRRRLDRLVGIRRCGRLCRGQRVRKFERQRSGLAARVHDEQGDRPRHLDRRLVVVLGVRCASLLGRRAAKVRRIDPGEVWRRFPKFVIGFFIAAAIVSLYFGETITPQQTADFLRPIGSLRGTVFTLCFLAIGLTTRFSELELVNWRAALAFAIGRRRQCDRRISSFRASVLWLLGKVLMPLARACRHFLADAAALERCFPGLTAMSSAYSAARADTGFAKSTTASGGPPIPARITNRK